MFDRILLLKLDNRKMCLYFSPILASRDKVVQKSRLYIDQFTSLLDTSWLWCPRNVFYLLEIRPHPRVLIEPTVALQKQMFHLENYHNIWLLFLMPVWLFHALKLD